MEAGVALALLVVRHPFGNGEDDDIAEHFTPTRCAIDNANDALSSDARAVGGTIGADALAQIKALIAGAYPNGTKGLYSIELGAAILGILEFN